MEDCHATHRNFQNGILSSPLYATARALAQKSASVIKDCSLIMWGDATFSHSDKSHKNIYQQKLLESKRYKKVIKLYVGVLGLGLFLNE